MIFSRFEKMICHGGIEIWPKLFFKRQQCGILDNERKLDPVMHIDEMTAFCCKINLLKKNDFLRN